MPGLDKVFLRAGDTRGRVARPAPTLRHVVEVVRAGGCPGLATLHRAGALQALWCRGFTHHRDPARTLRLLSALVAGARCWLLDAATPAHRPPCWTSCAPDL